MQLLGVSSPHVALCAAISIELGKARSSPRGQISAAAPVGRTAGIGGADIRTGFRQRAHASAARWEERRKWKKAGGFDFDGGEAIVVGLGGRLLSKHKHWRGVRAADEKSQGAQRVARGKGEKAKQKGKVGGEPDWLQPGSDELPPWARNEGSSTLTDEPAEVPFWAWLIASSLVAIAAIGSAFEYFNKNPIFGVIPPESQFYAPILGFFAISGLPTAGFLWFKATQAANAIAERMDMEDGIDR